MIKRNAGLVICLCVMVGWTWGNVRGAEHIVSADKGKLQLQLSQDGAVEEMKLAGEQLSLSGKRGGFFLVDRKVAKEINLLPNPSFEEDSNQDGVPDSWRYSGEWKRVREMYRASGDWVMQCKITGSKPVFTKKLVLAKNVPVKPSTKYKFSYWEKLDEVYGRNKGGSSFNLYLVQRDKTGKALPQKAIYHVVKGTRKWTKLETIITTYDTTSSLYLYGNMYPGIGTGYIDDISLVEITADLKSKEPVKGLISSKGNQIIQKASMKSLGINFEAVYRSEGNNRIRVDGKITDTTGKDRAIDVIFSLPARLDGWTWWDDIDNTNKIKGARLYQDVTEVVCGDGVISLLPFSAISNKEKGLSYGLPLSQGPRVYRIYYSAEQGYAVHFYLGLSKKAIKIPQEATFSFILYQHDGNWGMRSAAKKFYEFYPESFVKRTKIEGVLGYGNYQKRQKNWKNPEDFGKWWKFLGHHHAGYTGYLLSCKRRADLNPKNKLRYLDTICDAYIKFREKHPFKEWYKMPVTIDGEERVAAFGHDSPTFIRDSYGTAQDGKTAIDDCGAVSNFYKSYWMYPKGTSSWRFSFRNFCHPEIKGNYKLELTKQWLSKAKGTGNETITTDGTGMIGNISHTAFRPAHFKYTSYPLSYGARNKNLCIPDTNYDWNIYMREMADKKNIVLMNNIMWGIGNAFFDVPYIDIGGLEGGYGRGGVNERVARYGRTIMYQKLLRYFWSPGSGKDKIKILENKIMEGLHYGVFMGAWWSKSDEETRSLYKKYIPIIETISAAGWEPIPYARANDPEIHIERWGYWKKNNLHFTVRNNTALKKKTVITVDAKALGMKLIYGEIILRELISKKDVPFNIARNNLSFSVSLNPSQTVVIQLIGREGLLLNSLLESSKSLKEAIGIVSEHTELKGYLEQLKELKKEINSIYISSSTKMKDKWKIASKVSLLLERLNKVSSEIISKKDVSGKTRNALIQAEGMLSRFVGEVYSLNIKIDLPKETAPGNNIPVEITIRNNSTKQLKELKCEVSSTKNWNATVLSPISDNISPKDSVSCLSELLVPKEAKIGETNIILIKVTAKDNRGRHLCLVNNKEIVIVETIRARLLDTVFNNSNISKTASLEIRNTSNKDIPLNIKVVLPRKWEIDKKEKDIELKRQSINLIDFHVAVPEDASLGANEASFVLSWEKEGKKNITRIFEKVRLIPGVVCKKIKKDLILDGKLNEEAWKEAVLIDKFVLLKSGKAPTQKTEAKLLYTDKALYIGVVCFEDKMKQIKATKTVRDSAVYADDVVEIFLGIPDEKVPYYQIAINTLGAIYDSKGSDKNWNGKLKVAVYKTDKYWSLEMAIPFIEPNVNQAPESGDTWRLNIGRSERPHQETSSLVKEGYKITGKFWDLIFE